MASDAEVRKLKVDEDLITETKLRALSEEERLQLRDNIEDDGGINEPLYVWKEKGVVLDGHHRLEIYKELADDLGIKPPNIIYLSFNTRDEAIAWCRTHQIGRRNLTAQDYRRFVVARAYKEEVAASGGSRGDGTAAKRVAERFGVGERTVHSAVKMDDAVQSIEANPVLSEKVKHELRDGKLKLTQAELVTIGNLPVRKQADVLVQHSKGLSESKTAKSKGIARPQSSDAMHHLSAASKTIGVLQDHVLNASNCDNGTHINVKQASDLCSKLDLLLIKWKREAATN